MARFLSDQSKLVVFFESGTYANISGTGEWPGLVQSYDIVESENVIQTRYLGQLNRNVGTFNPGPTDIEGTVTLIPQDWRLLGFALGSISTTSGTAQTSNYRHSLAEVNTGLRGNAFTSGTFNPFISFGLEESRTGPTTNQQSVRTIRGCVANTYTLNVQQGEPVSVELGIIAQGGSWFSGNSTAVTAGSHRPYLWSDSTFGIAPDLAGTAAVVMESVKSLSFEINNNFTGPHYVNGSRVIQVPYPVNRDYSVEVTQDLDSSTVGSLYDVYFKGGSIFHAVIDINNTSNIGSHRLILTLSGCKMTEMELPAELESVTEVTYTFVPGSVSALAHDRNALYTAF